MDASLGDLFASWELFRDPIIAATAAGAVLGWLGVYVVLRRMVFVAAAVSQAAALGVALAFYVQIHLAWHISPVFGAIVLTSAVSLLFMLDPKRLRITRESILGLAFVLTGGAAVAIGDRISQEAHEIGAILFGTAVLVRTGDLWLILGIGGVLLAGHVWTTRGMVLAAFDPDAARVQGLPVRWLDAFLFLSIGVMVAVATRALGALPVFAFTVLPAMAALALGNRVGLVLVLSMVLGALSGFLGYVLAFMRDLPVGASQTLVAASWVGLALLVRLLLGRIRR
jgi:zinc transport system permease protein